MPIAEGWYIPEKPDNVLQVSLKPRWVLRQIGNRVCYSRGGDAHFYCLERSFRSWVKRTKAKLQPPSSCDAMIT
jgi:hypothetical protein